MGRFKIVNIKLDKGGGLIEALAMVRAARELGFDTTIGCMPGISLATTPAVVVGQLCGVLVDLHAPTLLRTDRAMSVRYERGPIPRPATAWGNAIEDYKW